MSHYDTSAARLRERLVQLGALGTYTPELTKEAAKAAIDEYQCDWAICDRVPRVGGKPATFAAYFALVYGETLQGKAYVPKHAPAANKAATA